MYNCRGLQYSECDGGAGLGISQRVMMPRQVIAAAGRDGLKLVVRQLPSEHAPGGNAGTQECVIRIVHAVSTEHRPQAPLVETAVVGHERQSSDKRSGLLPHLWKYRSLSGILPRKAVDAGVPVAIILRLGTDEAVEAVHDLPAADHHKPHAAHTGRLHVGRLEIYCCEISHTIFQ